MEKTHWQNAIICVVGLWLIGSTFYADDFASPGSANTIPVWNFILVGVAFAGLAVASLLTRQWWEEWALLFLSFWLAVSPWVLGYAEAWSYVTTALAAAAIVAVIAGATFLWSGGSSRY